jgi:prephenate dehydrogenase
LQQNIGGALTKRRYRRWDFQRWDFQLETSHGSDETPPVRWKQMTLVGVGLLGGSLGLAVKQRRLAASVVGYVRRRSSMAECKTFGAVDWATLDLLEAVSSADLIVLCTPIAQMRPLLEEMLPALQKGTVITDVGSVKGSVVKALEPLAARAGAHFVGSHPMAGAEKTGVAAARADLFRDAVCVVTPTAKSNHAAVRRLEQLWKHVGSRILRLSPQKHDALVSRSSHLPHVVAAGVANLVLDPGCPPEQGALCANGFRDATRIAASSPEMWRDISIANRKNLDSALASLIADLGNFRRVLRKGDAQSISRFFETAKQRRDTWAVGKGSTSPE